MPSPWSRVSGYDNTKQPTITLRPPPPGPPHYNSWPGIRSVHSHSVHTFHARDAPLSFSPSTPGSFVHSFDGCWDRIVVHCPGWLKPLSSKNPLASFSQVVTTIVMCNHAWSSIPYWLSTLKCSTGLSLGDQKKHTACSSVWQWRAEWIHSNQVWTPVMRLVTSTTHTCVYRVICELRRSTKFVEKFALYTITQS